MAPASQPFLRIVVQFGKYPRDEKYVTFEIRGFLQTFGGNFSPSAPSQPTFIANVTRIVRHLLARILWCVHE